MFKKYEQFFSSLSVVCDTCLISSAFFLAYRICWYFNSLSFRKDFFIKEYFLVFVIFVLLGEWSLYIMGIYHSLRLRKLRQVAWTIVKSMLLTFFVMSAVLYAFKIEHISRLLMVYLFGLTTVLLLMEKIGIIFFFRHLRRNGFNFRNVIVVGTGRRAQKFMMYLDQERELGLNIIGLIDEDPARIGQTIRGHKVLGTLEQMPEILRQYVVDFAVFIVPRNSLSKIEPAINQCETVGVTTSVAVDLFNFQIRHHQENETMCGIPMITYESTSVDLAASIIKRAVDILVSAAALLFILPLYLAVAVLIKMTSPGPVHFVQERCGLNGRKFKLYKFRTMCIDAEERLKSLMAYNEMQGPAFKMKDDPRVTPLGKFLRKFSIDELPQLWNVFFGDMSLVGPRPPLPKEVAQYDLWQQRRLSIRPGITCSWQAGGRNKISSFDQWVRMDLDYIDNWSLLLDLKILFKTIPAVLSANGAK